MRWPDRCPRSTRCARPASSRCRTSPRAASLSRPELRAFLERAVGEAGVTKVLLIGGDDPQARWPLRRCAPPCCARACWATAACARSACPATRKGTRASLPAVLAQALDDKLALADRAGPRHLPRHAVLVRAGTRRRLLRTPRARAARCSRSTSAWPAPTEPRTLLRFAQRCGVSASLRALKDQGMAAVRLVTHTDPGEQLAAVARYCVGHTVLQRRGRAPLQLRRSGAGGGVDARGGVCARLTARWPSASNQGWWQDAVSFVAPARLPLDSR